MSFLVTRRAALQAAGVSALAGWARAGYAEPLTQVSIAIIGDGNSGIFASLRSGVSGLDAEKRLGLKLSFHPGFTASLPVMEAIRAGAVDLSFATATAVVGAVGAGIPIVPLAAYPLPADEVDCLVQADSGIHTTTDLKGRSIAYQRGTTGAYSLIKYLATAGLRLSDVKAVNLNGADALSAFSQGGVEAWIHWQPASALALAKLGLRARRLEGVKTYDYAFYVAREEAAKAAPESFAALVRLLRDTQVWINAHPKEATEDWARLGAFVAGGEQAKVYQRLIEEGRLSDSSANRLRPVDEEAALSTQDLADNFHDLGVLANRIDVKSFLMSPKFDAYKTRVANALA